MPNKIVVTIARQYGSGGRYIGRMVAKALGIPMLDKEIIARAVQESGISADILKSNDETAGNHWGQGFANGGDYSYFGSGYNLNDQIFLAESKVIKEFAWNDSCVIIGRCASYVLGDQVKHLSVFINADMDDRVERVNKYYLKKPDSFKKVKEYIHKVDKKRAQYHHFYTDEKWMDLEQYDLTINSTRLGLEETAKIIIEAAKNMFKD